MKLRVLALLALTGALVPVWASEVITHDMRINRQRITTVLNAPNAFTPPVTVDSKATRQRISSLTDVPGMVRDALPNDPQIDRRCLDGRCRPRALTGLPFSGLTRAQPGLPAPTQEKGKDKDKAVEAPKVVMDERAKSVAEKVTIVDWRDAQFKDDKGRVWCLVMGHPEPARPTALDGWVMQAADSPILFFTKTGRLWRLVTMPLP
ncbi:MAG: hypothetical protein U0797_28285 [Gemmataceae bacterium]